MRKALRIIPLILALAIIAACGAESAAETPDVTGAETPRPTASPEPSPEAEAAGLPQYFTQPRPVPEALDFRTTASPSRNAISPSPSASPGARCCCAGRTVTAASASPADI